MLAIDGAYGEGGGQLLRTAVALAAVTGRSIAIDNIRARRPQPGLAPQHRTAIAAVAALCAAQVGGLAPGARSLTFVPGRMTGGSHRFDIGTAGSVTLVLHALLPVLVACGEPAEVTLRGGTDIRAAPPVDYFIHVTLPLLARIGIDARLTIHRRGYFPRGGGEVTLTLARPALRAREFPDPGAPIRICGLAQVAGIDPDIARRMRDAFACALAADPGPAASVTSQIDMAVLGAGDAEGSGGAIVAWAMTEHALLGAGRVAQRGVRAEVLGSEVASELAQDLRAGVSLDVHAADQLPVYLALAGGGAFSTRELTSHARTAMWLIGQFLPVRFACTPQGPRVRVRVQPATATQR
ncbi:MAG: RNA 3'-terminal phosphate cyclase [Candidatus Levyibacteriota bacterium]